MQCRTALLEENDRQGDDVICLRIGWQRWKLGLCAFEAVKERRRVGGWSANEAAQEGERVARCDSAGNDRLYHGSRIFASQLRTSCASTLGGQLQQARIYSSILCISRIIPAVSFTRKSCSCIRDRINRFIACIPTLRHSAFELAQSLRFISEREVSILRLQRYKSASPDEN